MRKKAVIKKSSSLLVKRKSFVFFIVALLLLSLTSMLTLNSEARNFVVGSFAKTNNKATEGKTTNPSKAKTAKDLDCGDKKSAVCNAKGECRCVSIQKANDYNGPTNPQQSNNSTSCPVSEDGNMSAYCKNTLPLCGTGLNCSSTKVLAYAAYKKCISPLGGNTSQILSCCAPGAIDDDVTGKCFVPNTTIIPTKVIQTITPSPTAIPTTKTPAALPPTATPFVPTETIKPTATPYGWTPTPTKTSVPTVPTETIKPIMTETIPATPTATPYGWTPAPSQTQSIQGTTVSPSPQAFNLCAVYPPACAPTQTVAAVAPVTIPLAGLNASVNTISYSVNYPSSWQSYIPVQYKDGKPIWVAGHTESSIPLDALPDIPNVQDPQNTLDVIHYFDPTNPQNSRYTATNTYTNCNTFVIDVSEGLHGAIPRIHKVDQSIEKTSAEGIDTWMKTTEAKDQGWASASTGSDAQAAANQGYIVVAVMDNTQSATGHTAIVLPTNIKDSYTNQTYSGTTQDGEYFPPVAQAGAVNGIGQTADVAFHRLLTQQNNNVIHYYIMSGKPYVYTYAEQHP